MLYFDHSASTPVGEKSLETLHSSFQNDFANPSSAHKLGRNLTKELEKIRADFCKALDAPASLTNNQFIFTSSATESNNMIIKGLALNSQDEVLFSRADHPSVVAPVLSLEKFGIIAKEYKLNKNGQINIDDLLKSLTNRCKLIIVTAVNNQSGSLHNILELSKIIKTKFEKIHIHIDASQSFMKYNFSIKDTNIDSMSISGHKVLAPKGIAGLYIKNTAKFDALFNGGGQEFKLRPSTISLPLIKAFRAAVFHDCKKEYGNIDYVSSLNQKIRAGILEIESKCEFPFTLEVTSVYIITFILPNISSDIILRHLEEKDIFLSSSSACSSRAKGHNNVFEALGIETSKHKWVLRLSITGSTKVEEVDKFLQEFKEIYEDIKQFF